MVWGLFAAAELSSALCPGPVTCVRSPPLSGALPAVRPQAGQCSRCGLSRRRRRKGAVRDWDPIATEASGGRGKPR